MTCGKGSGKHCASSCEKHHHLLSLIKISFYMASFKGHFLNWNFVSNVTDGLTTVGKKKHTQTILHRFIVLSYY